MVRGDTNFADFLPRRLAWGTVIIALLAVAIFVLPNLKFGAAGKKELNLADRNTYMQMLGMTKAEIQQKLGPPKSSDPVKNELIYDIPNSDTKLVGMPAWVRISFDKSDHCTSFAVED